MISLKFDKTRTTNPIRNIPKEMLPTLVLSTLNQFDTIIKSPLNGNNLDILNSCRLRNYLTYVEKREARESLRFFHALPQTISDSVDFGMVRMSMCSC